MDYLVKDITSESEWEGFVQEQRPPTFLQSWAWGEHYKTLGSPVLRFGVYQANTLVATALVLGVEARRGKYLLCPHGPIFKTAADAIAILPVLDEYITRQARQLGYDFIRICSLFPAALEVGRQTFQRLGYRNAPIHMHPELSWILDVTPSEEDLLARMRKTTRYLIKKGEKEGVKVVLADSPEALSDFWPVYEATVQRQKFTPFDRKYLESEFKLFAKQGKAILATAHFQNEIVAAAIIIFYGNSAFYHHSGSVPKFTQINPAYLLQWRIIQEAKKRGLNYYNFWGISDPSRPNHPWAGLSLFKKGFGGFAEEYLRAQDKPLTAKYYVSYFVETLRRIRRGV